MRTLNASRVYEAVEERLISCTASGLNKTDRDENEGQIKTMSPWEIPTTMEFVSGICRMAPAPKLGTCHVKDTLTGELAEARQHLEDLGIRGALAFLCKDVIGIVELQPQLRAAREKRQRVTAELHCHVKQHGC